MRGREKKRREQHQTLEPYTNRWTTKSCSPNKDTKCTPSTNLRLTLAFLHRRMLPNISPPSPQPKFQSFFTSVLGQEAGSKNLSAIPSGYVASFNFQCTEKAACFCALLMVSFSFSHSRTRALIAKFRTQDSNNKFLTKPEVNSK